MARGLVPQASVGDRAQLVVDERKELVHDIATAVGEFLQKLGDFTGRVCGTLHRRLVVPAPAPAHIGRWETAVSRFVAIFRVRG